MNNGFKPISRLSIIFILAVLVSGSVLTYFSINSISNLRALTEKKIREEQHGISSNFSETCRHLMNNVTTGFINEISPPAPLRDSLLQTAADFDFIRLPFIVKNEASFPYPNFQGIAENPANSGFSKKFQSAFSNGEQAEFATKRLATANDHYRLCLQYATGSLDSVKALNALGRISVKKQAYTDAIVYYKSIVLNHYNATSTGGLPYAYYAIPQLLKISTQANCDAILPTVEYGLARMKTGSIPLNFSLEELLNEITVWMQGKVFAEPKRASNVKNLVNNVRDQLHFTSAYSNRMAALADKRNAEHYPRAVNGFKVAQPFSGDDQHLVLINPTFKHPAGFVIDRNALFHSILNTDIQSGLEFDYLIELSPGYNAGSDDRPLSYSASLHPYFPGQMINIKLQDENLIKSFITRRSWIYGIASFMLLVAMILGVVLILRDISREKHLARLRSDFISNVTHELKTPLTSIRMYAESLMMERVKSKSSRKEYLSVVVQESERLKRMINNILDLSKMERSKLEYHPVETCLAKVLDAALRDVHYWIEEKDFEVTCEIDRNLKMKVDPEKLQQVYTNLLSNAIKYSEDIKKIYVRLFQNSQGVVTEIEDKGIGIARDEQSKIFEEFYRVEHKHSGEIAGTGLGLTVVKEIVEAHKGKLLVESEIGKGSKFSVILFQP